MTDNGTNGAKPEFDFSNISWDDSAEIELLQIKIHKAQADNDAQAVRNAYGELKDYYAKITRSIPRAWLVSSAPDPLDLTLARSYGYLRADKTIEFLRAAVEAQNPEETTKN